MRTGRVLDVRQAGLNLADELAEKARREEPRPERSGRILTDGRKPSQGGSDLCGYIAKLPADFLAGRLGSVGSGQSSRFGGIRGGTQSVSAHVGDRRSLPCGPGGGCCRGCTHVTSGATTDEAAADLLGHDVATSKGSRPRDRVPGAAILGSFGLEQPQHPLRAVCCPDRDDPPIAFAQRLRRARKRILLRPTLALHAWVGQADARERYTSALAGRRRVPSRSRNRSRNGESQRPSAAHGWLKDSVDDRVDGALEEGVVDGLSGEQQA